MGISPNLDRRLLYRSGAAGSHTHLGRAGDRFHWDEKQQNPQDRLRQVLGGLGEVLEKQQPEGESLEEALAAGGESRQAGLPCRGGAGACTGPVSGLVCTEQHSKAAIVE